jgi:hypothetical protein
VCVCVCVRVLREDRTERVSEVRCVCVCVCVYVRARACVFGQESGRFLGRKLHKPRLDKLGIFHDVSETLCDLKDRNLMRIWMSEGRYWFRDSPQRLLVQVRSWRDAFS